MNTSGVMINPSADSSLYSYPVRVDAPKNLSHTEIFFRHFSLEQNSCLFYEVKGSFGNAEVWLSSKAINVGLLINENNILKRSLKNVVELLNLSKDYVDILSDSISSDDYDKATPDLEKMLLSYVRTPRELPSKEIVEESRVLLNALDRELGSDELAEFLNLDVMEVENALSTYSKEVESLGLS